MAMAHPAGIAPRVEQRAVAFDKLAAGPVGRFRRRGPEDRPDIGRHVGCIAFDDLQKHRGAAEVAADLGSGVKARDIGGQRLDQWQRQTALIGHGRQQAVGGKAFHLDQPVGDLALIAAEAEPRRDAAHRHDTQIDFRRGAAVERHFALAGRAAPFAIGKIQKGEAHRLFQLEGMRARQEHMRDMRLDMGDRRSGRQAVALGLRKKCDQRPVGAVGQDVRLRPVRGGSAFRDRPDPGGRSPPSPGRPPLPRSRPRRRYDAPRPASSRRPFRDGTG